MLLSIEVSRLRIESFFCLSIPFLPYHGRVGIRVMVREWFHYSILFFASLRGQFCPALVVESFLVIDTRRLRFNSYVTIHSEVALFLMQV